MRMSTSKANKEGAGLAIAKDKGKRTSDNKSSPRTLDKSHRQPASTGEQATAATGATNVSSSGDFNGGAKARRRGSIRNAVKRIFGRRSSRAAPPTQSEIAGPEYANVPRHAYHKSEPNALTPPLENAEAVPIRESSFHAQTLENRYQPLVAPGMPRTTSPYAVQFPNSVRLKPMALGQPQMTRPNQLRRRQTLPSMVVAEHEAPDTIPNAERPSNDIPRVPEPDPVEDSSKLSTKRIISQVKKNRRRSRSADDLKSVVAADAEMPRKRSEEIKYWRESFQPDVLRASGFTRDRLRDDIVEEQPSILPQESYQDMGQQAVAVAEEEGVDSAPFPAEARPGTAMTTSGVFKSSPPRRYANGQSFNEHDERPLSGAGTEMSRELEDRVAKLEAGLETFQRSLQRLTAERNRRTIVMAGIPSRPSSKDDMRTPSLLADTLVDDLEPSSYQYDFRQTPRPSTSQRDSADPFGPQQPPPPQATSGALAPVLERSPESVTTPKAQVHPAPLQSHPPAQQAPSPAPAPPAPAPKATSPQPYTFSSLYQMLADERSARRKLETQLRNLQLEIADLHSQVAFSPDVQSARSSYMLSGGSSRLQDLLRDTESEQQQRLDPRRITSRFSGSESEAANTDMDFDDVATPYENYQTPREERSKYSLVSRDDDVF